MPRLCPIDLLMKEHKPPTISGLQTRAITLHPMTTIILVRFLIFCIKYWLQNSQHFVLKKSLSFTQTINILNKPFTDNLRFATYDVTALYPSIDLERGLKSLEWFLGAKCNFNNQLSGFILTLSCFVLTLSHCYFSCPEISKNVFHQVIGTAMGTSFAVVYAHHSKRDRHLQTIWKRYKSLHKIHWRWILWLALLGWRIRYFFREIQPNGVELWVGHQIQLVGQKDVNYVIRSSVIWVTDPNFYWLNLQNSHVMT